MSTTVQQAIAAGAGTPSNSGTASILGKDDFLKLLVQQLQHQDPLEPMKGTEFAAQLAQFSSVEQLSNINENLQASLNANGLLTQSINNAMATTFIGKEVRAKTDNIGYSGSGIVKMGYSLPTDASTVTLQIVDNQNNVIRTVHGLPTGSGDHQYEWDGKNDAGNQMAAGTYKIKVVAADASGKTLDASTYAFGKVQSVRYKSSGTVFVIDDQEVLLANITEISGG
ncbi:MAG: flagellar hook capping protein [Ignavibacteriales bacterium]|nr:flagellar hook capping protein [Ignavibacteriales bacterium]